MTRAAGVSLAQLPMINRIGDARREQLRLFDALKVTGEPKSVLSTRPLVITIDGQTQDEAMLARVRPVIEAEVRARIASLDRDLEAMGVIVGRDA